MQIRIDLYQHTEAPSAVLQALERIEQRMATQNESIQALKVAHDALKETFAATSAEQAEALSNIQADEAAIIAKLGGLSDLSPENQAVVDGVVADSQKLMADLKAQADAVKAVADAIPDEPVV